MEGAEEVEGTQYQEQEESVDVEDGESSSLSFSYLILLPGNPTSENRRAQLL